MKERDGRIRIRRDVMIEAESNWCSRWLWKWRKEAASQGMKTAARNYKRQRIDSFLGPPVEMQAFWHCDLSLVRPISDIWPQNYRIISMCCFKPWSLLFFYSSYGTLILSLIILHFKIIIISKKNYS